MTLNCSRFETFFLLLFCLRHVNVSGRHYPFYLNCMIQTIRSNHFGWEKKKKVLSQWNCDIQQSMIQPSTARMKRRKKNKRYNPRRCEWHVKLIMNSKVEKKKIQNKKHSVVMKCVWTAEDKQSMFQLSLVCIVI